MVDVDLTGGTMAATQEAQIAPGGVPASGQGRADLSRLSN
jgi:hypothetical protein